MLNCFSIAHSDAHVTNEIIKYGSVDVKPMVDMWPSSVYNEKLKSDLKLLEYDSLLRSCYTEALKKYPILVILKKYPIVQLIASLKFQCFERLIFVNLTELW